MTIRILSIFMLISSLNADASIRLIGRGGGYAEMKALTALSKLKNYLAPCIQDRKNCGISEEDHKILVEVERRGLLDTSHARLEFFTSSVPGDVFRFEEYDGSYIGINSASLYTPDGKPGNYSSIISTVLTAWFLRPPVQVQLQELMPRRHNDFFYLFDHILRTVKVSETDLTLDNGSIFREVRIYMDGKTDVLIAIEHAYRTLDLTPFIRKQLPCSSGHAKILEMANFFQEGEYIIGRMRWSCGENQTREGRFHLKYVFPEHERSLEYFFFNVVNMTEYGTPSDCAQKLGDQ